MKTKLLIALTLVPIIGMAHPGHKHNVIDIILDTSAWSDHAEFLVLLGVVLLALIARLVMKKTFVSKKTLTN